MATQPEILAADFRPGRDGPETGTLKLIAGLLSVGLDELVQREKEAERNRRRRANLIASAMSLLAIGASAAGAFAWWQSQIAEENAARAETERGRAEQGEQRATIAQGLAERTAAEREEQRQLALLNAAEAEKQASAAQRGELAARTALARVFAERSWSALERGDVGLAARYAVSGYRTSSQNAREFSAALAAIIFRAQESVAVLPGIRAVTSVAYSPDGKRIVTSSADMTASIWDTETGQRIKVLEGHRGRVNGALFAADSTRIATFSDDATARIWDAISGRPIAILSGHSSYLTSAAFSPDGKTLATASRDRTVRLWETATGRLNSTLRGHRNWVISLEFSPDGLQLLTASHDNTAKIWSVERGDELCTITGHRDQLTAAHYLDEGQRVATASRDGSARLWEAGACRELATVQEASGYFYGLSPSQAGDKIVAWANDGTATVFDSKTLQHRLQLKADGKILSAAFGPHGDRVLTTSSDGNAQIWEAASGRLENQFWSSEGPQTTGQFSPSGDTFATGGQGGVVRVRRTHGWKETTLVGHAGGINALSFNSRGTQVLTGSIDQTARLWDASSGKQLGELRDFWGTRQQVFEVRFSPDDRHLLTRSTLTEWWEPSGARVGEASSQPLNTLASFSADGRFLVSTDDRYVRIHDVNTGTQARAFRWPGSFPATGVSFLASGRELFVWSSGRAALWNATSGAEIANWPAEGGGSLDAVVSDDRQTALLYHMAFPSLPIQVIDLPSRRIRSSIVQSNLGGAPPSAFEQSVRSATEPAFIAAAGLSSNGTRAAIATADGVVKVFDTSTGREIAAFREHAGAVTALSFSAEGARIISSDPKGAIRIWDVELGRELASFRDYSSAAVSPSLDRIALVDDDEVDILDATALLADGELLVELACADILAPPKSRRFSQLEISADPLIREVWLRDHDAVSDMCAD
ncbi:MAG: WD40 repeat domain-containing protein [Hyphomonadaceae bacterium]